MDKQVELQQWKKIADSDLNLADFSAKNKRKKWLLLPLRDQ